MKGLKIMFLIAFLILPILYLGISWLAISSDAPESVWDGFTDTLATVCIYYIVTSIWFMLLLWRKRTG